MPRKYDVTITYTIEGIDPDSKLKLNPSIPDVIIPHLNDIQRVMHKAKTMVEEGFAEVFISDITIHQSLGDI